jgi:hypothetical protein
MRLSVRLLSLLPLEVIDQLGKRVKPFTRRWEICAGAWVVRAKRDGVEM